MPSETNAFVKTTAELESSMSCAMITIGSGVGHLAAVIFSALAYGVRFLSVQARVSQRRSRASNAGRRLTGSQRESYGV